MRLTRRILSGVGRRLGGAAGPQPGKRSTTTSTRANTSTARERKQDSSPRPPRSPALPMTKHASGSSSRSGRAPGRKVAESRKTMFPTNSAASRPEPTRSDQPQPWQPTNHWDQQLRRCCRRKLLLEPTGLCRVTPPPESNSRLAANCRRALWRHGGFRRIPEGGRGGFGLTKYSQDGDRSGPQSALPGQRTKSAADLEPGPPFHAGESTVTRYVPEPRKILHALDQVRARRNRTVPAESELLRQLGHCRRSLERRRVQPR